MKIKSIAIMSILLFFSCSEKEIEYSELTTYFKNPFQPIIYDSSITCITYNIQLGFKAYLDPWNQNQTGADIEHIKLLAKHLKVIDPDIVALQEVPRNRYNAVVKEFIESLANEMQMNFAFASHGFNDPYGIYPVEGEWGLAVLTKFEVMSTKNTEIEHIDVWQKRNLQECILKLNDSIEITLINIHYLPTQQGIQNTAEYMKNTNSPLILMGDFNYSGEIHQFSNLNIQDSDSTYSTHGIDRIFYSKNHFEVVELGILDDTLQLSDHWAHYAVFRLK